jgi:hypothetical protein
LAGPDNDVNILSPVAMHVSDTTGTLYLASSRNQPGANSTSLYIISKQDLIRYPEDVNNVQTVKINGMGHITDITEDPATGTVWVVGFSMPEIPAELEINSGNILDRRPFYKPYLAKVSSDAEASPEVICLSDYDYSEANFDLALPMSVMWTGPADCSAADISDDGYITFTDFAIFGQHWQRIDCDEPDWCAGADLNKSKTVDIVDLAILSWHWLETGCNSLQ